MTITGRHRDEDSSGLLPSGTGFNRQIFLVIFVDQIFTTLAPRLFTKLFDVTSATRTIACVYYACNAD
jgi:hypothetical protein